jgi:hypothetical protein
MRRRKFITALGGGPCFAVSGSCAEIGNTGDRSSQHLARRIEGHSQTRSVAVLRKWNLFKARTSLLNSVGPRPMRVCETLRPFWCEGAWLADNGGALAARAATSQIPIVFVVSLDPVTMGLASSIILPNHPPRSPDSRSADRARTVPSAVQRHRACEGDWRRSHGEAHRGNTACAIEDGHHGRR